MSKAHVRKCGHINKHEIITVRHLITDNVAGLAGHCMEDPDTEFVNMCLAGDETGINYYRECVINNATAGETIEFKPFSDFAMEAIKDGGLSKHFKNK